GVGICGSILFVVCALVGAVTGGVVGTVRGTAISVWVGALVIWWQLRVAMRESGTVPASAGFLSGRPAGRHRPAPVRAVTPCPDIALDATVPIPAVPKAAAFAPAAATSSPPSTEAGQAAPRGPVKPAPRPKMPAAARAVLATGVMTALAGVAVAGWMLVHQSAGFCGTVGAQAPATATAQAHAPGSGAAPPPPPPPALQPASPAPFDLHCRRHGAKSP